ncbi:MAG TPA: hypothetical protein VLL50_00420 [Usitatibacter sp.]|nr:hypothetical protein [Usitatibacter sp.]
MPAATPARTLAFATLADLFSMLCPQGAEAGRPMITDDARILDPKACQVETWTRVNRDSTEYWLMPACNPFGPFELGYGSARTHEDGRGSALTENIVQLKTVVKPLQANGWGWGISLGTDRHLRREAGNGWPGDVYLNFPVTLSFRDDEVVMLVNAGAVNRRDLQKTIGTWGLGSEIRVGEDLYFLPETFGNDRGRPFYQLGLRYWIVKDWLEIDGALGNRLGGDTSERWFTIGLHAQWPPFSPAPGGPGSRAGNP